MKIIYFYIIAAHSILKINVLKYFLHFFLFIFIFTGISSVKADPTVLDEFSVVDKSTETTGITFNDNGEKMYISGSRPGNNRISQYSLSTGFDLSSTVEHVRDLDLSAFRPATGGWRANDIRFNNDGSKMFLPMIASNDVGATHAIHQFGLSVAYDISSASSEIYFAPSSVTTGNAPTGIEFNDTGTKMFLTKGTEVKEYTLSSAFDLQSTVTLVRSVDLSAQTGLLYSLAFNNDGTILFVVDRDSPHIDCDCRDIIYEYSLSSAYDISTLTLISQTTDEFVKDSPSVAFERAPAGLAFNDNGSKLFFVGRDKNLVIESSLPGNYTLNLPVLSSHVPADDATGVSEVADIVLNFSEIVEAASTEKFITIKKGDDVVEAIDVRGSQVTGSGSTQITINPSVTLESQTAYHILIDNGAIVDTAGEIGRASCRERV